MYDRFVTLKQIDEWLAEDIGCFDLTSQLMIDPAATAAFYMNAREPMTHLWASRSRRAVFQALRAAAAPPTSA